MSCVAASWVPSPTKMAMDTAEWTYTATTTKTPIMKNSNSISHCMHISCNVKDCFNYRTDTKFWTLYFCTFYMFFNHGATIKFLKSEQLYLLQHIYIYNKTATEKKKTHRKQLHNGIWFLRNWHFVSPWRWYISTKTWRRNSSHACINSNVSILLV